MLSLDDRWYQAIERGGEPAFIVDLDVGPIAYLSVAFTCSNGDTVDVSVDVGGSVTTLTIVAGTDFVIGASAAEQATNIASALSGALVGAVEIVVGARGQLVAVWTFDGTVDVVTIVASNDLAHRITPDPVPKVFKVCTGQQMIGDYIPIVDDISPITPDIDAWSRAFTLGNCEISFSAETAGVFRDLVKRVRMKGKRVTIRFGTVDLDPAYFAPAGVFVVDEVTPSTGSASIRCIEPLQWLETAKVSAHYVCMHPISIILDLIQKSSAPASLYAASSLDISEADYNLISHWALTRSSVAIGANEFQIVHNGLNGSETAALDAIQELLELIQASFTIDEIGQYLFRLYDADAAVVATLTDDDIDEFEQLATYENLTTTCGVFGAIPDEGDEESRPKLFVAEDSLALRTYTFESARAHSTDVATQWLGVPAGLAFDVVAGSTHIYIFNATQAGLSGSRVNASYPATTQDAHDTLSSDRHAFLLLHDGIRTEIVEVDEFDIPTDIPFGVATIPNAPDGPMIAGLATVDGGANDTWRWHRYRIFARGVRGTTEQDWVASAFDPGSIQVYDVTIAIHMAETRVARFSNGCAKTAVKVPLHRWALQVGDFVAYRDDEYLNFQKDGADENVVWEIVGKELHGLGDSAHVLLKLAWARDDVSFPIDLSFPPPIFVPPGNDPFDFVTDNDGLAVSDESGFLVTRG